MWGRWATTHLTRSRCHAMVRAWLTTGSRRHAGSGYASGRFPPAVISRRHGRGPLLVGLRRAIPGQFGCPIRTTGRRPSGTSSVVTRIKRWATRLWCLGSAVGERAILGGTLHPRRRMDGASICGTRNSRSGSRRWIRRCMAGCGLARRRRRAAEHRRDRHAPTGVGRPGYRVERRQFSSEGKALGWPRLTGGGRGAGGPP